MRKLEKTPPAWLLTVMRLIVIAKSSAGGESVALESVALAAPKSLAGKAPGTTPIGVAPGALAHIIWYEPASSTAPDRSMNAAVKSTHFVRRLTLPSETRSTCFLFGTCEKIRRFADWTAVVRKSEVGFAVVVMFFED